MAIVPNDGFRLLLVGISLCLLMIGTRVEAQTDDGDSNQQAGIEEDGNEVVVTASRLGGRTRKSDPRVFVINRNDLENWSGSSVADILERLSTLDVMRRSPAQADLSLRGSGFEQVLVLVDGIPVNDPQTGHHNLDLPLVFDDIERIELLPGVGSSLYGPGAYSGVVNFITRAGTPQEVVGRYLAGSDSRSAPSLSVAINSFEKKPQTPLLASGRFSVGLDRNRGQRPGTESASTVLSQGTSIIHPGGITRLRIGFLDRSFGADKFYGPYPSWEATDTLFVALSSSLGQPSGVEILPRLSYRRHHDEFLLDRTQPLDSVSKHITQVVGGEFALRFNKTLIGSLVFGVAQNWEAIESSTLGKHDRNRTGLFAESQPVFFDWLRLNLGMWLDLPSDNRDAPPFFSPSVTIGLIPAPSWSILLCAGRGLRLPSFTELYYQSPANQGDPSLTKEETWASDLTLSWLYKRSLMVAATAFVKYDSGLIDWVKSNESEPWKATNIGSAGSFGGAFRIRYQFESNTTLELAYTRLQLNARSKAAFSKYVFRQPIDDVLFKATVMLPLDIKSAFAARYRRRPNEKGCLLLDASIRRQFGALELYAEAANILNVHEEEIPNVPSPGFSMLVGLVYRYR